MDNFNQIMDFLLKEVRNHPDTPIDKIILDALENLGFSSEEIAEFSDVIATLDLINDKATALDKAREKGLTRTDWIKSEFEKTAEVMGDNSGQYLDELEKELKNGIDNI